MSEAPRDQSSDAAPEDAIRQSIEVVTSDLETPEPEPRETDPEEKTAEPAEIDNKKVDPNDPDSATDTPKKTKPKRDRKSERRIKSLSSQLNESKEAYGRSNARVLELEEENERLKVNSPKPKEPLFDDFDSPQEYAKEYSKWEKNNSQSKPEKSPSDASKPPKKSDTRPSAVPEEIQDFQARGEEKLGELFTDALSETGTAISQAMAEFIMDSEFGPELYVHLSNNVELSQKLYDKNSPAAMRDLIKLEAKAEKGELDIDGDDETKEPPAPSKKPTQINKSKAKEPPSNTREKGGLDTKVDPSKESMDDYSARRHREHAERNRRY